MRVVKYMPEYQQHFAQLNKAWLKKYFEIEPPDEAMLSDPADRILKNGGQIFFVEHQEQLIGTVALIFVREGVYELAKMAVDEAFQGIGAGKLLCNTAIEEAKKRNADKLILFTNLKLNTAIHIYRKLGFKYVDLEGQVFVRANIKMELLLKPQVTSKWFDRQFDLSFGVERFDHLLASLTNFPMTLQQTIDTIPEERLAYNEEGKWSVKENIGHLYLLEHLWRSRFQEMCMGKDQMSPADLSNTATGKALFNQYPIARLTKLLASERGKTITFLKQLSTEDLLKSSVHPRLKQPMRVIDLMYFVAEHDQHHLAAILNIIRRSQQKSQN